MARIAGVDIPNEKRIVISLQYVYGIGLTTAKNILTSPAPAPRIRNGNSKKAPPISPPMRPLTMPCVPPNARRMIRNTTAPPNVR